MNATPDSIPLTVRIVQPARCAMQSGRRGRGLYWAILPQSPCFSAPDPLMGSPQSDDMVRQLCGKLLFPTARAAAAFAARQGWSVEIVPHHAAAIGPKNYLQNFKINESK